jgi:exopolysaccharide production protein ExoQ
MDSTEKVFKKRVSERATMGLFHRYSKLGYCGAILFLIFCAQPALTNLTSYDVNPKNDVVEFLFQSVAYGAISLLIRANWGTVLKQFFSRRMALIVLITALAFASAEWSDVPGMTIRRSFLLLVTELIAVYFSMSLTPRQQLRLVSTTLLILLVISLIVIIMDPTYGTMPRTMDPKLTGNWRGVFPHKNTLGRYASLSIIIFVLNWMEERRVKWLFAILLAVFMLFGSKSMTSIAVTAAVLVSLPMFRLLRSRSFYAAVAVIGAVFAVAIRYVFQNFYAVVDMMGRDITLSGRLQLWVAGVAVGFNRNPWLEYGWADFWRGYDGPSATVWRFAHWQAPNIHNGFLELWLALGFLGLICFGTCHILTTSRAIRLQRTDRSSEALWPLAFLVYFTLQNLTESIGVNQNSLVWILYVMVVYQVYEVVAKRRADVLSNWASTAQPISGRKIPVGALRSRTAVR